MKKKFTFLLFLLFTLASYTQQISQVQSAYIYHFTKYIEWPTEKQSGDFIIGVVGDSPIIPFLRTLAASKKAGMQKIVIKQFATASAATNCHILFLSSDSSNELSGAISKGIQYHSLVITEKKGCGQKGSGINFVLVNGKARFEINESST